MASQGKGFVMPGAGTGLSYEYENLQGFFELFFFTQRKALGTEVCAYGEIQSMKTAGGRKKECSQCFKEQFSLHSLETFLPGDGIFVLSTLSCDFATCHISPSLSYQ